MDKSKEKRNEEKNFLLYVPKIAHDNYKVDNDIVTLYFTHNKMIEKFARWLVRKNNVSDITLDSNSSMAWLLIDENRNIYEIAVEMSKKTGDTEEVSIERLVMYMRYLSRKGWVKFHTIKIMN